MFLPLLVWSFALFAPPALIALIVPALLFASSSVRKIQKIWVQASALPEKFVPISVDDNLMCFRTGWSRFRTGSTCGSLL